MSNNKYKILIVEDEANIRSFIKANLETSDYQVICAETCTLGIMLYASHHPDLIILDLGLPDRDGLDLIQKVRESDYPCAPPSSRRTAVTLPQKTEAAAVR